jgi:hypothetical protein
MAVLAAMNEREAGTGLTRSDERSAERRLGLKTVAQAFG